MPSATQTVLAQLAAFESPNVTYIDPSGRWPIVWDRARGVHVWDAEGRRYVDHTAAFGVAAAGHANAAVIRAGRHQMGRLLHAMGDVHPHALKARLAQTLSELTFGRWPGSLRRGRVILGSSGFEAVEAALKTARLVTGKPGIIAFQGAYHGLGYGTLNATQRDLFRAPFRDQLREFGTFVPWPPCQTFACPCARTDACDALKGIEDRIRQAFRSGSIGAILAEPIQARGGIRIPVPGFLPLLRRLADEHGALLILDEIYTGFGRTGRWFACEHSGVVPDLICLGKALTGGFPLSACVGRADLMEAWPPSTGEAIHTSTFLGHPVGCAMALAQVTELRRRRLPQRSARLGRLFLQRLRKLPERIGPLRLLPRGLGLLLGIELQLPDGRPAGAASVSATQKLLHRGFIVLPEGDHGEVLSFSPPLTLPEAEIPKVVQAVHQVLLEVAAEQESPSSPRPLPTSRGRKRTGTPPRSSGSHRPRRSGPFRSP